MLLFVWPQVYRHGDRSPTHIYPNDPWQEDVWPQGMGMLTQVRPKVLYQAYISRNISQIPPSK